MFHKTTCLHRIKHGSLYIKLPTKLWNINHNFVHMMWSLVYSMNSLSHTPVYHFLEKECMYMNVVDACRKRRNKPTLQLNTIIQILKYKTSETWISKLAHNNHWWCRLLGHNSFDVGIVCVVVMVLDRICIRSSSKSSNWKYKTYKNICYLKWCAGWRK